MTWQTDRDSHAILSIKPDIGCNNDQKDNAPALHETLQIRGKANAGGFAHMLFRLITTPFPTYTSRVLRGVGVMNLTPTVDGHG